MSAKVLEHLDKMISSGLVKFIFEAEQSLSLIESCGRNQEFLANHNFGELFGTIQGLAINQFVLAVTKLYEMPSSRYRNLSVPSVLSYVEENTEQLEVQEMHLVRHGFELLGIDTAELNSEDASAKNSLFIARRLRERVPDVDTSEALRALKALRDKKVAHPEDIDIETIEKTTWEEAEKLLILPRAVVGIIGDAYLATAYWDYKGCYLGSVDGSRVGRAMQRLIEAASK